MSELKAIRSGEIYNIIEYEDCYRTDDLYYPKSEADKVIAELKAQKARAEDDCAYWEFKAHRECHNKYKRCLAMARWCKNKVDAIKNGYMVSSIESQDGVMTTCPPECNPKFFFYVRWHKRWLELAEKFKEAK